jgi:hypothetical protein
VRRTALVALALAPVLAGCQTTQEKSAQLEKAAKRSRAHAQKGAGLRVTRPSRQVRVVASVLVHGGEGSAAVVTLRNTSATALREIPLAIEVAGPHRAVQYTNAGAGLSAPLTGLPYLAAHATVTWVDDQVQYSPPATLRVRVGEAPPAHAAPALSVSGVKAFEDPSNGPGAEGMVLNRSTTAQHELVVYAVARRGGRVVAAGRGVIPLLAPGQSTRFAAYLVGGSPSGASLEVAAPPSRLP